jgi:FtsH-binding integral membrane protein
MNSHPVFVKIAVDGTYHKEPVVCTVTIYCNLLNAFIMNL